MCQRQKVFCLRGRFCSSVPRWVYVYFPLSRIGALRESTITSRRTWSLLFATSDAPLLCHLRGKKSFCRHPMFSGTVVPRRLTFIHDIAHYFTENNSGYRHSSVDSSAPSILVRVPSTHSTLLSLIVTYSHCAVFGFASLKRTKITTEEQKEAGFGPLKAILGLILICLWSFSNGFTE